MIIENVTSNGANRLSSLGGGLTINENTGELVIRNSSKEVLRLDKDGFKYFDQNSVKRISMGQDSEGLQQIVVYGANGTPLILVGQDPKDSTPVIAVSESGTDVLTELQNG